MLGFHIDMNVGQFKADYLEKWLKELAALGYNTIIWEVENNIQWETCSQCVSPDAFTKQEFRKLLNLCTTLGIECIPLLQTLGHCEYVLKHKEYKHFAELPNRIDQYCPLQPQLPEFLKQWIDEYLDLFGKVRKFHIGADEAFSLGKCPRCADFVKKYSLSELYIQHINSISNHLINKGIRPIIWADMLLHHPEHINKLSPKIILADWMYDINRGNGKVWVWGQGLKTKEQLDNKTLKTFGKYIFPSGNTSQQEPETFYTADFLAKQGFETITCPSSSSYGDNIFTPRYYHHTKNIYDSIQKGSNEHLAGSILTSWTIHLFPWEMQQSSIELAAFTAKKTSATFKEQQQLFLQKHFGIADSSFFEACELLSNNCLFTYNGTLGFYKSTEPVCPEHVQVTLENLIKENKLQVELENCFARLKEYEQSLTLLTNLDKIIKKEHKQIYLWQLAARNLVNRAKAAIYLLETAIANQNLSHDKKNQRQNREQAASILSELYSLKKETKKVYEQILKPTRLNEFLHWIYDTIEIALKKECKYHTENKLLKI